MTESIVKQKDFYVSVWTFCSFVVKGGLFIFSDFLSFPRESVADFMSFPLFQKPKRPFFSLGPCAKALGWNLSLLDHILEGRSHRSLPALRQLQEILSQLRSLLGIPSDYQVAIVPGSATGAFEMGLWNLLGPRSLDVWSFNVFGCRWAAEIRQHLPLSETRFFDAPDGELPAFSQADFGRDQVFTWCGTTSGVWLEEIAWISRQRQGLTFCDATSAVFSTPLPWVLLDVTTFSWQKGLRGEGGHGILVLSSKALERLRILKPSWPIPKLLRLKDDPFVRDRKLEGSIFAGFTLNTPSLLAVADCLWGLNWAKAQGGMEGLMARVKQNFEREDLEALFPWLEWSFEKTKGKFSRADIGNSGDGACVL